MFTNYFKIAFRNLLKHKTYSIINILGLAIGIAATILILLFIQFEFSYDKFHENANSIYRVSIINKKQGNFESESPEFVDPLGPALKKDLPEVEDFVRISTGRVANFYYQNQSFKIRNFRHADSSLFKIFSFSLINGDEKTALSVPYSIVLSEKIARTIFGTENPIGKHIKLDNREAYQVTGVVKEPPVNSHIQFNAFVSFSTLYKDPNYFMGWNGGNQYITYVKLMDNVSPSEVESKLPDLMWDYINDGLERIGIKYEAYLQPLKDIHIHYTSDFALILIYIFGVTAVLILIIACINFVNLSIALSSNRAKEVGVRKVMGANRRSIIKQFLIESIMVSFLALIIAIIFVQLFFPAYTQLVDKNLQKLTITALSHLLILMAIFTVVGIGAGSYPAFYLSSFQSAQTLKGGSKSGVGKTNFRNGLVIFQFAVSITLFICTVLINSQLNYMKKMELGFNNENIMVIPFVDDTAKSRYEILKQELIKLPEVLNIAGSSNVPYNGFTKNGYFPEGSNSPYMFHVVDADEDFLKTFDITLVEGRDFSKEFSTDKNAYLVNETLAKSLKWENPLGRTIRRNGNHEIIGVVEDFNYSSLHDKIEPLIITNRPWNSLYNVLSVKVNTTDVSETINSMKKIHNKIVPSLPFEFYFLDEKFDTLYRTEQRFQQILFYFSCLVIIIALCGLFSLASFSTEQRTREIGIRKVLGASVTGISSLLSKEFIKLVVIAYLIACPIAWFIITKWLQIFAYRINIGVFVFVVAGLCSLLVAFIAVSYQAIKAALANPIDSLRYE